MNKLDAIAKLKLQDGPREDYINTSVASLVILVLIANADNKAHDCT